VIFKNTKIIHNFRLTWLNQNFWHKFLRCIKYDHILKS
jgi:hypothetical protein